MTARNQIIESPLYTAKPDYFNSRQVARLALFEI
jgi:hypothetical protein